jgi:hypothetical protein
MESRHLITSEIRKTASQEMPAIVLKTEREGYWMLALGATALLIALVALALVL